MKLTYDIGTVCPYINWAYFYHAWQIKDAGEQKRIRQEAEELLESLRGRYHTYALFRIEEAWAENDDIMVRDGAETRRLPCLRQQQADSQFLCLADFLQPHRHHPVSPATLHAPHNTLGLFATSVDGGMEHDFDADPYQKMMAQLLADRLAEATAERMHEEVRKRYWGYAADEDLPIAEMQQEHFQGIRPAVGYPSLPDASMNFLLDRLLDMQQIGIQLTENGAMRPHASVSGLMLAHPQARYFSIGRIGDDQLRDYARRRGFTIEKTRKFLAGNL